MRDEILVRLSRADAEQSRETVAFLATLGAKYQQEDQVRPLLDALDAALAAPAEGPERAAAAIWKPGLWEGHKIDQIDKELSRQDARHVLEAVFGAAIGGGGE